MALSFLVWFVVFNLLRGHSPLEDLVVLVPIGILVSALFFVAARSAWKGTIALDERGVTFNAGWARRAFPWADISQLRTSTFAERGGLNKILAPVVGMDSHRRFVELGFSRPLRFNILKGSLGTRVWGIPNPFLRRAYLYPDDLEAFLAAAHPYLVVDRAG